MTVTVNGQNIYTSDEELIVSESVDIYECEFEFDSTWDGWDKTAKFEGSGVTKEMILIDDKTTIPDEVIKEDGWMRVGVYGTRNAQEMPTIWGADVYVHHGTEPESTEITPTPSIYAQILNLANGAKETADGVANDWAAVTAEASTLAAGSPASASFANNKFTFGIPKGDTGATGAKGDKGDKGDTGATGAKGDKGDNGDVTNIADAYSTSATYAVGDYCIYNSLLYRCTTAITTAEAWTAAHWTAVQLGDDTSTLRSALNNISGQSINIANVLSNKNEYNGVILTGDSIKSLVTITGTANSGGDTARYFLKQNLTAGTYTLQFFGSATSNVRFAKRVNGSTGTPEIFEYIAGSESYTGRFTLSSDGYITLGVQTINGTVYNGSFYVQIISGTTGKSSFISPLTALDTIARDTANEALSTANANSVALLSKLDQQYYWGVGNLPTNKNNGENTLNPTLLYAQNNDSHYPGVRVVADNSSPVASLFGYKHEVYKGTQTGWQSVINDFVFLGLNVNSFSFGFWVNVDEVNAVFTSSNYLDLMLLSGSRRFTVRLYPSVMISNVRTVYTLTIPESIDFISSATATGVCLENINGYAYIKFDVEDIVYANDVDAYVFSVLKLYWRFDNVVSSLSNKQVTFIGITAIQNDTIKSGYYRYPDENGLIQVPQVDPLYKSSDEASEKPMTIVYSADNLEDTHIICTVGNVGIEHVMVSLYDDVSYNRTCRPAACFLTINGTKKQVMKSEDDGCPVNLTSGYLAAGHGYIRGRKVTKSNHGKTYADIGSEWVDSNSKHFYLIRIFDENNIGVMPKEVASNQYDLEQNIPSGSLTHVSDAVHADTISDLTSEAWQIEPIVMANHEKKILIDGTESITESGTYYGGFVDVVEEYDVANPQTIASALIANKPDGGYTENPDPNVGVSFMHFSNVYRFLPDGTMLIVSTIDEDVDLSLGYWGGTQYAEKNAANVFGGSCKKYIPATLPVTVSGVSYDMRTPVDMSGWNVSLDYASTSWEDADYPPDRIVTYYTDSNNVIKAGYAVGYLPIGLGDPSVRKGNVSNALNLYSSKKYYPHLIDSQVISAYTPMQSVVYRKPVINVADKHTSAYFVPCGDKCYLYADYHAVADDRIKVPAEYIGKPMTIINKTDNVTVYGTIATDEIRIRCTTASPMYGYAVVQIG